MLPQRPPQLVGAAPHTGQPMMQVDREKAAWTTPVRSMVADQRNRAIAANPLIAECAERPPGSDDLGTDLLGVRSA